MRKLLTALGTATILMASNAIIWKAEAAMVTGVGNLPLSNSYSLAKRFAASAALMDAPAAAAIGHATRAIGPIDITAMAIGPTVMGIAGAISAKRTCGSPIWMREPVSGIAARGEARLHTYKRNPIAASSQWVRRSHPRL